MFSTLAGEPLNVKQAMRQYGNFSSEELCEQYVQDFLGDKPFAKKDDAATVMYFKKFDSVGLPELQTWACIQINLQRDLFDRSYKKN